MNNELSDDPMELGSDEYDSDDSASETDDDVSVATAVLARAPLATQSGHEVATLHDLCTVRLLAIDQRDDKYKKLRGALSPSFLADSMVMSSLMMWLNSGAFLHRIPDLDELRCLVQVCGPPAVCARWCGANSDDVQGPMSDNTRLTRAAVRQVAINMLDAIADRDDVKRLEWPRLRNLSTLRDYLDDDEVEDHKFQLIDKVPLHAVCRGCAVHDDMIRLCKELALAHGTADDMDLHSHAVAFLQKHAPAQYDEVQATALEQALQDDDNDDDEHYPGE